MPRESSAVTVGDYRPQESEEALAIERACPQGRTFRLTFARPTFHRRAETFAERRIVAARAGGRLAGVLAVAIKPVTCQGTPARAAFLFDLRVHPHMQGRGITSRLAREALSWAFARAEIAYLYTVAENEAVRRIAHRFRGAREVGGYKYLVVPTAGAREQRAGLASSFDQVHEALCAARPRFDFYARPSPAPGYVGSWLWRGAGGAAGCSAWDHRETLAETVAEIPWAYRALSAVDRSWPWRAAGWPRIPRPGETVRSWYVFDFFAHDGASARALLRHVAAEARARGIDYLYLIHQPGDVGIDAVRADHPRLFAPVVPYRLLACVPSGPPPAPFANPYVDVRDL